MGNELSCNGYGHAALLHKLSVAIYIEAFVLSKNKFSWLESVIVVTNVRTCTI